MNVQSPWGQSQWATILFIDKSISGQEPQSPNHILFADLHEVSHAVYGLLLKDGFLQLPWVIFFVQADVTAHPARTKFLEVGLGEYGILRMN